MTTTNLSHRTYFCCPDKSGLIICSLGRLCDYSPWEKNIIIHKVWPFIKSCDLLSILCFLCYFNCHNNCLSNVTTYYKWDIWGWKWDIEKNMDFANWWFEFWLYHLLGMWFGPWFVYLYYGDDDIWLRFEPSSLSNLE